VKKICGSERSPRPRTTRPGACARSGPRRSPWLRSLLSLCLRPCPCTQKPVPQQPPHTLFFGERSRRPNQRAPLGHIPGPGARAVITPPPPCCSPRKGR
jgi:hypothetical protein